MNKTPNKYWHLCVYLSLALVTIAVFWQLRSCEFISFDDDIYIFDNNIVKAGLTRQGVIWAFTKIHAHNWHPLTWLSHMLDCQLFSLNAGAHHFTNLLLHTANALLLLLVFSRMTANFWAGAFVAAVFALHPLHVESVAWASERKDVLSTFFWILTMYAYIRYAEHPQIKRYLLTLLFFALGLMAKQMLVTLPFVLLLLDYWPLRRLTFKGHDTSSSTNKSDITPVHRCILEKLPLVILALAAGLTVYLVQYYTGVTKPIPFVYRAGNAFVSYIVYITKMLWPARLAIFYPHLGVALPLWKITGSILMLLLITIITIRKARRCPYLPVGWFWFLITLVPVIGFIQVGLQAFADRYTYMPLTGLFLIIAWAMPDLLAQIRYRKIILSISAAILLLALSLTTCFQTKHWRSSSALYARAVKVTSNNWWAHDNLSFELLKQRKFDDAIAHSTKALQIKPDFANAHNNLALALQAKGKLNQALSHYYRAIEIQPHNFKAHNNLANALLKQSKFDEALKHYRYALQFKPDYSEAHYNLGMALASQGNINEAISCLQQAVKIKPGSFEMQNNFACLLASNGRFDEAITHFQQAVKIKPDFADAHYNLGVAFKSLRKFDKALDHYRQVLKIKPNHTDARRAIQTLLKQNSATNTDN